MAQANAAADGAADAAVSGASPAPGGRGLSDEGAHARARADARAVFERAAARRAADRSGARARPTAGSTAPDAPGPSSATNPPAGTAEAAEPVEPTRSILLVGPGTGFGTQLLARFAAEGFVPAVISRSADTVARVVAELAELGVAVRTAVADVTDPAAFTAAVGRLAAETGGLTVVVYNAKLSIRGTALTVAAPTLNQTLAVNVTGAVTTVQASLPLLVDRPGATVVFTVAGPRTTDSGGRFALALGKAGLAALASSVAPLATARGVRLRTVSIEDKVAPDGPLAPAAVAEQFWRAYAAPRGSVFRLGRSDLGAERDQLPLDV